MRLNKFFMGVLGALALTACSSEEIIPDKPNIPEEELNSRFMTVSIRNSELATRAGGDQSKPEESNDLYEEGLDQENDVTSIRFYFFDKDGNPYKVSHWRLLKSVNAKLLNSVFMLVTRFSGLQTLSHFSNDYIGVGALKLGSPIFHECRTIHF